VAPKPVRSPFGPSLAMMLRAVPAMPSLPMAGSNWIRVLTTSMGVIIPWVNVQQMAPAAKNLE